MGMQIVKSAAGLKSPGRKLCLAIGVFDGVHLGHQQIIRQTVADARQHESDAVVLTFDRHPNSVVAPDRVPPLIYSLPQKLRAIESLGPDGLLLLHFDEAFSRQTGEEFVCGLVRDAGPIKSLCVGADFVFGYRRSGDVDLMRRLGAEFGFSVHGLAAVALEGRTVSSTRIREAIRAGDLDQAGQMLGRNYSLAGAVLRGDGIGRNLGFPTANIDTAGLVLPPNGVYAVHAQAGTDSWRAVLNIGFRPTLSHPAPQLRVEAHLLGFHGDLYGRELELSFVEKLRDERKFDSLAGLKEQIARDIAEAEEKF